MAQQLERIESDDAMTNRAHVINLRTKSYGALGIYGLGLAVLLLVALIYPIYQFNKNTSLLFQILSATPSPSNLSATQAMFLQQIAQMRFLAGLICGVFFAVLGGSITMLGLHAATREQEFIADAVPPGIVELREKRKLWYLMPGLFMVLASVLVLSLTLFSRLPGIPVTPPPEDAAQKGETAKPKSETPTPSPKNNLDLIPIPTR